MEITRNDDCSSYGAACTQCNDLLIAPERSWHVDEHEVYHFWSCENCGHSWLAGATNEVDWNFQ